ncbi:MAG TPA: hypothetical protein VK528_05640 [Flavobacterium sp.]|nr:hypothetical protein [Flavobacterium sp.]
MKILSLLFLTIFLGKGCDNGQKQDIDTAVIEYTANTRGYFQRITIQKQTVTVSKDRNGKDNPKAEKISDAAWKALISEFQEVNLEDLQNLKGPTEKRFYDGAAIGNLKITYKGKTYETNGFDHGVPPAEIEGLVNKMLALVKEE